MSAGTTTVSAETTATEAVIRHHLDAFLRELGIDAIVSDYAEHARFLTESRVYHGRKEIHGFFTEFVGSLPPGAIDQFTLRAVHVDGDIGYITWSVGAALPLGTDTFVAAGGKIISQTFAMHAEGAA